MDSNQILTGVFFAIALVFFYRNWKNSQSAAKNISEEQFFLKENANKENVKTTKSGLQYEELQPGTGDIHPTLTSQVKVHYHGTLINGSIFDSSVDRGTPITFGVKQVIKGWQEGLQLMVVGQKVRFYVPHNLAYGKRGMGKVLPGSMLIFDVELLEIL
jgi:peptidylprolyl isomerase